MVEFDLSFSSDGVAVVFHDDELDRTTNGTGKLEDKTYEEVKQTRTVSFYRLLTNCLEIFQLSKLDAAHNHIFKQEYSPEPIPTVENFVKECLKLDLKMIIDLKSWKNPDKTVEFILDLYKNNPDLYTNAMVSTFFPHLAYLIRKQDPKIVMGMAWRPYFLS